MTKLFVLGSINANLDAPRIPQDDILAAEMQELGLTSQTRHYVSKSTWHVQRKLAFCQLSYTLKGEGGGGGGRAMNSRQKENKKRVRSCRWQLVRRHGSDHQAIAPRVKLDLHGCQTSHQGESNTLQRVRLNLIPRCSLKMAQPKIMTRCQEV